jgi:TolB-like protein/class 3 adenylate cyclase/Tfp pilus assembly protein PilF
MASALEPHLHLAIGHILFLDIVGYSKLLADEQKELVQELNRVVRETEQFREAEAEGKLTRLPTGDGMVLVFTNNPEAPVECALEISKALQNYPKLKLRMGIHSGPVNPVVDVNDQANLAGAGINMAQRVMSCGDTGHILLSKNFAEHLEHYAHWQSHLHALGECDVKHGTRIGVVNLYADQVGNPQLPQKFQALQKRRARVRWVEVAAGVLVVAAIVGAFIFLLRRQTRSAVAIAEKSIAVLPFENRSEDKANAYFADGIQDEILTRLSKIADLKVISRTSTQHYKSAPENLPDIAKQLGVAHILEGSVQKSDDAVRVNVQLIKAATDSHVWADTFDRRLTDIFSVESEIAKAIADRLRAKLTGEEEQVIAAKPTDNAQAHDAYLRGLAYNLRALDTPDSSLSAQKYLREAVRLDPRFALAWAWLSYVDSIGYLTLTLQPTAALREEARRAAETALNLQANLAEAILAKGWYHYGCLKDYDTAERYFEQARALLPNSSQVPESLAYVTRRRGEWDKSESYFNEAEWLDPRNVSLLSQHALSYLAQRRFPEALGKFDQILSITPDNVDTLTLKAAIAQAQGYLPRASAVLNALHLTAKDTVTWKVYTYQAILEHRTAEIIPRLKEILASPDPALGFENSELRFWLGWAEDVAGDHVAAQDTWRQARNELEAFLKEEPTNYILIGDLALTNVGLGDKTAALALAERAMAVNPMDKDAMTGPSTLEILARVAAQAGERDRAITALEKLMVIPYAGPLPTQNVALTAARLRMDPMFDPLRGDPRFDKLTQTPAN